ncbi:MAG TPA: rhomboid family intramembrane serine protease [Micromonospora sp.]|nr:rhomboid family intramembrane serine protease [Micromonospora sp.]
MVTGRAGVGVVEVPSGFVVRRAPVLTVTALAVAVVAAIVQYAAPAVVPVLERDGAALAQGQWWRWVTPLLVQTLGWHQILANLVALALIGLLGEWLLGRWRWAVLFAAGTLGGQVAAYAWHEPGGGASIAICGLAGGMAVALLVAPAPTPWLVAHPVIYYLAALTGWGFSGLFAAGVACLAAGLFLSGLRRARVRNAERIALAGTVVCTFALAAARDLHGVSLLSGMAVMVVILAGSRQKR